MKLTIDLDSPEDRTNAMFLIERMDRENAVPATQVVNNATIVETPTSTAAISTTPENREDPANPEVDTLGMPHNAAYHQSPPALKADGSFKMLRGQKVAYEAAVAAHKAETAHTMPTTPTTPAATTGMPGMPGAAPQIEVPAPVVGYEDLCARFTGLMGSGVVGDFAPLYKEAGIPQLADGNFDATQLQTDETLRANLSAILDRLEES